MLLKRKHLALLKEIERRDLPEAGLAHLCYEISALASQIDRGWTNQRYSYQLSEKKCFILLLLLDLPKGLSLRVLTERADITRAMMSGVLDELERDGFLRPRNDGRDHSNRYNSMETVMRLTAKGQAAAREMLDDYKQRMQSLFTGFSADERQLFSDFLRRTQLNVKAMMHTESADE